MRKNVFSSSIKILIVSLLLLAVFFQKERSQKLMALALILWGAVTAGIFLFRKSGKLAKKCRAFSASLKQAGRTAKAPAEKTAEPVPKADTEPAEPASPAKPAPDSRETETMLLHISLRITEKLKSAYPQSVWQWKDTPSLQGILAGGTVRILVENMDAYTHADISFDRFGRIHVEPMTIGSFAEPSGNGTSAGTGTGDADAAEEMPPEPSVVDVRVWYELVGQKVLETQITDLNANGHTKLTIKENGDIVVNRQKKEVLKGTLDSFPAKSCWEELVLLLTEDELKGKIAGNTLQVSWI
ncbi:hypothetical protein [uncultured Acetatifactor sp.]|uniref:hypothetical protein n=1 Tax=uncultured Acetatifactor sp. TaxID=1671927 RepID=UPI002633A514|nr:hypothetical protein [uncultured Acetatifactor sp.]